MNNKLIPFDAATFDPNAEVWKDIDGFEGKYQVSNMGNVKSLLRGGVRIMKHSPDQEGYRAVTLSNVVFKRRLVHRLVALAFIPNPNNKPLVNHIDGDKANNKFSNLEWCTPSENVTHGFRVLGAKHWKKGKRLNKLTGNYSFPS